ncbi:DUF1488 family protein [Sinisalibacter aestuarii]|uniref:DUF1488 domain-containing protein n=1 Tax=Sinisalibacter aestuarii TaxID=2949426 RepID=A0ABQ5LU44_9RHOB|nr:DUF1488 family protein [Sinisalibacter aestuarii]GKY88493.1 hypothetical protein STA1M1_23620 [Sinisalibacter aestuarii]
MAEISEGPWKNFGNQRLHFRATIFGCEYLCAISALALVDDYQQPGNREWLEIFQEFEEDILRRAEQCLPENPVVVDGLPTVIIKQGDALGE